ncbi:MAG: hypothetical protein ED555_10835 [Allomuricauda sp.]|nr:MAG: hypothetical protein ED555_10835 [Allomuricauda sp.]
MLSIAIIFPLVFTIRGSFRRREKAMEHLSQFRSALKTLHNYVYCDDKLLTEDHKNEMFQILVSISEKTISHLKENTTETKALDQIVHQVQDFVIRYNTLVSGKLRDRIFRFMSDLHESLENLHAINTHRTPISLKAYCKIFIYLFPLVYAPTILHTVGTSAPLFVTFFIVLLTQFILVSLYNIQDQLEYPFDDYGLDDINLEIFKIDR